MRELVDTHLDATLSLPYDMSIEDIVTLTEQGRWLQRWPRCTKIALPWTDARACLPFAAAAPEALQRIEELTLGPEPDVFEPPLPSSALHNILSRLHGLRTLTLNTLAPPDELQERAMVRHALSLLPRLTSLSLTDFDFLSSLPDSLTTQLTRLRVGSAESHSRPPMAELTALVARLTALQELSLRDRDAGFFTYTEVCKLLDALPPTARSLWLSLVGMSLDDAMADVTCTLAGGLLTTVGISECLSYAELTELSAGLLQSHTLGPRLGHLSMFGLDTMGFSSPSPAEAVLQRCDKITVDFFEVDHMTKDTFEITRHTGIPRYVTWEGVMVDLRQPSESSVADGGGCGGAGVRGATPLAVLSPAALVERVMQCMLATAGRPGQSWVLLRGPLMQLLVVKPAALRAWMQRLSAAVTAADASHHVRCYRALPEAGTVAVSCDPGIWSPDLEPLGISVAAAAAARHLAAEGRAEPCAKLDATEGCLSWRNALQQVLQALWDGTGDEDSGGAGGQESGASGSRPEPEAPSHGGGVQAQLEDRLRSLLETWGGLRSLPEPQEVDMSGVARPGFPQVVA